MAVLTVYLEGNESDLLFLRERAVAACEELVREYEQNLDGEVEVGWDLESKD